MSGFLESKVATKLCKSERQITKDKCINHYKAGDLCQAQSMGYGCPLDPPKRGLKMQNYRPLEKPMKEQVKEIILEVRQHLCNTEFAPEPFTEPIDANWFEGFVERICQLFEPKGEKPPVLSDKQIEEVISPMVGFYNPSWLNHHRPIATAQRDDTWQKAQAYYEPIIERLERREMNETFRKLNETDEKLDAVKVKLVDTKFAIQQAKAEVAREIFEEIEKERFAEPQYIPEAGKEPVIITYGYLCWHTSRKVADDLV